MRNFAIYSIAALSLCVSCAKVAEVTPAGQSEKATVLATKAVNSDKEASPESFLVKFHAAPSAEEIAAMKGIKSVEPLFTSIAENEALEKRFGLDLWYVVEPEAGVSLVKAAETAASLSCVSKVEFNTIARKPDCTFHPMPVEEMVRTKASTEDFKIFNDPQFSNQWHYINVGDMTISKNVYAGGDISVKDVWASTTCGDPSIVVCVIDEGVKWSHPDLIDNAWTNTGEIPDNGIDDDGNGYVDDVHGYNFVDKGAVSWDLKGDGGHGTHTAGTIAAVNNNGIGVVGVAGGSGKNDGVRIMSAQIFSGKNGGSVAQAAAAIKYAADNGASLISCSFGYDAGTFKSDGAYKAHGGAEYDAMLYFNNKKNNKAIDGGIIIFSAGNESTGYAGYPGALENIISVSALGPDYLPTYYSNYGPGCKIAAPGGEVGQPVPSGGYSVRAEVLSTFPSELSANGDDYGYMQGTSMACPHVTGVAALGIAYALKLGKHYTVDEFNSMIVSSAKDIDARISSAGSKTVVRADGSVYSTLKLSDYYHNMGSGCIDAWSLMMKIEGVPCSLIATGSTQWVDLSPYFGTASTSLTYTGFEMSKEAREALGVVGEPELKHGRLYINASKIGSAKVTINAIGGGTAAGTDTTIGGMAISREISIITRGFTSATGGWL